MGKSMYELKDMLCEELEHITEKAQESGEISSGYLDYIDKLTHSIKSIDTIIAMDDAGYSSDRGRMYDYGDRRESYNYGSYARGRRGNVRRDAMGRYSRDDAKRELMEYLEDMERDAKTEDIRRMVQEWKRQAEKE